MNARDVLLAASSLLSVDGENVEYDRAILELTSDLLGLDDREALHAFLRMLA